MSARRSHGSLGDLISTLVFSGMALLAFLTGFGALEAGEPWRAAGIWFTGFLCFLGASRMFNLSYYSDVFTGESVLLFGFSHQSYRWLLC